jgi:outer membrane lipoprotein-sorting protein
MTRNDGVSFGGWSRAPRVVCLWIALLSFSGNAVLGFGMQEKDGSELQKALNKMDEVAKSFRGFSAKFSQKKYTAILEEYDTPETGEFYYAFAADKNVLMRHEITNPGKRILTIKGDTATLFKPVTKEATIYRLGKYKDLSEYLALGIGQRASRLQEKFDISLQGTEPLNGAECYVLVFKPKEAKAAAQVASITIWLKKTSGLPTQYKFLEPNGDYLLVSFFDEKLNPKIPGSKFEQKFGSGVEIVKY